MYCFICFCCLSKYFYLILKFNVVFFFDLKLRSGELYLTKIYHSVTPVNQKINLYAILFIISLLTP